MFSSTRCNAPIEPIFQATFENARFLASLIRTIQVTPLVTLTASPVGFKFSAQDSSSLQASAYLQKELFSQFAFHAHENIHHLHFRNNINESMDVPLNSINTTLRVRSNGGSSSSSNSSSTTAPAAPATVASPAVVAVAQTLSISSPPTETATSVTWAQQAISSPSSSSSSSSSSPSLSVALHSSLLLSNQSESREDRTLPHASITVDMNSLLECLQLYQSVMTGTCSSNGNNHTRNFHHHHHHHQSSSSIHPMQTTPSTSSTRHLSFPSTLESIHPSSENNRLMGSRQHAPQPTNTNLRLLCLHPEGPLELILSEHDILSVCKLAGLTPTTDEELAHGMEEPHVSFTSFPESHHVILNSDWLHEALLSFSKMERIALRVESQSLRLKAMSDLGTSEITCPSNANMVDHFHVVTESTFVYTPLAKCLPALAISTKASLRTNTRGFLNMQCMVPVTATSSCFVDFVIAPLEIRGI